ncbi:MAG: tetratricopeptide repeat protein [Amphritea sp.]
MRTEEEQVEALKNWWKANGKSLLLGIALALAIVFAWNGWQNNQRVTAENASIVYQNLVEAVAVASAPTGTEEQLVTAQHLAATLKDEYDDSVYARFGALLSARLAADAGDFDAALAEFDWVLAQSPDDVMQVITKMRKARVIAAKGDVQSAVTLLEGVTAESFKVSVEELKGDLYLQLGDRGKARTAYQNAMGAVQQKGARPILTIKLDNLAVEGS